MKLMIILIMNSLFMMTINHPLMMGCVLLMNTIIIILITGMMNINFWYSYILFMIMVGGLMILFIYMTSIASNEKFKIKKTMYMIFIFTMIMPINSNLLELKTQDQLPLNKYFNFPLSLNKFTNLPNKLMFLLLIIYLMIIFIAIIKITNIKKGSLRQK